MPERRPVSAAVWFLQEGDIPGFVASRAGSRWIGVAAAAALALVGPAALAALGVGPLSHHMGLHLLLMNALAPLVALLGRDLRPEAWRPSAIALTAATTAQMLTLWLAHLPAVLAATHAPMVQAGLHALLFVLALWFWWGVFAPWGAERWRALVALLVTGKLACLLGVLLVFAARPLYPGIATLEDQQQAGVWMIAACMLTYVLAAIALAVRWLVELSLRPAPTRRAAGPA